MLTKTELKDAIATSDELLDTPTVSQSVALIVAVDDFHFHYDNCTACHTDQTALCPEGNRLNELASKLRDQVQEEQ